MWQREYEKYRQLGFTVVGIALDAEGIAPAKLYYRQHGVTFPALVDPNYATGLGAVPKTFFVNEHGVVQPLANWRDRLRPANQLEPVTSGIRAQWSAPGQRLDASALLKLAEQHQSEPADLSCAVELASRYLQLHLTTEASGVLRTTMGHYRPLAVARSGDPETQSLLARAYFQLSRASEGNRREQVEYATMSFYLSPSVGYGKQIARIIDPAKFDHRPGGDFDNRFREATLSRLRQEREAWLRKN